MHPVLAAAPLVIGLLLPPEEPQAESIRRGATVGAEESGARLAVRGRPGPWGSDAAEAARLVEDEGARALIAPPGGAASHLALQISGRTAVPVAMLCADASVTRAAVPWAVRVAPSTGDEARALLAAAPRVRWVAFVPAGRDGREAEADLRRVPAGAAIARFVRPDDASPLASLLAAERAGAVLLWRAPAESGRLARALRAAGFGGLLAGPSRLDDARFREEAGPAADAVLVPAIARGAAFARRYRARWGAEPDAAATLAHDAAALLAAVLRGPGEPFRAFPLARPVPGASGPLSFDSSGNRLVTLRARRLGAGAR